MVSSNAVRILEKSQISPATITGSGDPLLLNIFDFIFISEPPVVRVFYYRFPHPTADFIVAVLPALKSSLSATLNDFHPLAGRIRSSPDSGDNLVIRFEDGDSVPFTLAEYYDADFDDISGDHDRDRSKLRPLFSHLETNKDDDKPLLAVQVTVFPNTGFTIAVSISHVACDGRSFMHFVRSWACGCRAAEFVEPRPSFDRSTVKVPEALAMPSQGDVKKFFESVPQDSLVVTSDDTVLATFKASKANIEKLKKGVSAVAGTCSSFSVTCACAWVSLVRARGNYKSETRVVLNFSADCRARLSPGVSPEYFGNCVRPCFCEAMVSELIAEDGVEVACDLIQKTVKQLEGGLLEGWEKLVMFAAAEERMSVNGSPRFAAYDTEFGWGKPVKVEFPELKTGCIALVDCREEQGGIEIGVALTEKEMKEFRSHFIAVISLA